MALDILSCILGGGSFITLIIFLIKRHDEHKEKNDSVLNELKTINSRLDIAERDAIRTQILVLISNYDDTDEQELLTCAEHYFKKKEDGGLEGDWYMTSLFKRFCKKHNIELPTWFSE